MFPVRGRKLQKHVTNQNIEFVAYWWVRDFAMYKDQPFMLCNQASSFEHPQTFVRFNLFIKCKSNSLQVRLFKILWKWVLFYKDVKAKLFDTVVWTVTLSKGGWRVLEGGRVGGEAHCERFFETILYGIPWFS